MAKTLEQISIEIIDDVVANFAPRLIDTRIGTVMRDAIISPIAARFFEAFVNIDRVSTNQSIQSPENLDEGTMDSHAANVGLSRFQGSPSSGIERFVKFVTPTASILIPAGTRVASLRTTSLDQRSFKTLSSVELTPTSPSDPETGAAAFVDVAVIAEVDGLDGNVDTNTVVDLLDPIIGVDSVFNPAAMSGGKDLQSNTELADLIQARSQGRLGTRSGYVDLVRSNFSVLDVNVIAPDDLEATRSQFGGAIDVIALSNDTAQTVETFSFVDIPTTTTLSPTFLPLARVNSITGNDAGDTPITLSGPASGVGPGTDYDVTLDTFGPFAGSFLEQSVIVLHPVANVPKDGSILEVTYENVELIRVIQSFLDLDDNKIVGADVLAKAPIRIESIVDADIRVIPGFDSTTVASNSKAAVEALFNGFILDDDVQSSDVITVIGSIEGVDFVDLTTFKLALASDPGTPLQQILATKQQFVRAQSVVISVI